MVRGSRGDWIRTSGPLHPMQVRYQAAPLPEQTQDSTAMVVVQDSRMRIQRCQKTPKPGSDLPIFMT